MKLLVGQHNKRRATRRPRRYDQRVKKVLVYLWECFDQMCGDGIFLVADNSSSNEIVIASEDALTWTSITLTTSGPSNLTPLNSGITPM